MFFARCQIFLYSRSLDFLISHIFQCKHYISMARTGDFIMYTLCSFLRKQSHVYIFATQYDVAT